MVDFIYMGLLELRGARTENNKMKNSLPKGDSNPVPSAYEANSLSVALLDLISIGNLKVDHVLPWGTGKKYTCITWKM